MQDVIRQEMKDHLKDIDYDSPRSKLPQSLFSRRDLIDSYLIEMKTSGDPEFHGEQLTMMGMDLMSAGSDVRIQNLSSQTSIPRLLPPPCCGLSYI